MLIRKDGDALVIVRQTDHMAQVARIAERWCNERFPAPEHHEETIRAAGLHHHGGRRWAPQPMRAPATGRPRNLGEIEPAVHAAFYRTGVDATVVVDPYPGLLVSLHAAVLAAGVEGWDLATLTPPERPDLGEVERAFIAEQATLQRRLRAALAASLRYGLAVAPRYLWPAYLRLRFWDRLSLYFVFFGMGERVIDRAPSVDGEATIALRQVGPREATADPWPFDRLAVDFPVVVARVPDRRYACGRPFSMEVFRATISSSSPLVARGSGAARARRDRRPGAFPCPHRRRPCQSRSGYHLGHVQGRDAVCLCAG